MIEALRIIREDHVNFGERFRPLFFNNATGCPAAGDHFEGHLRSWLRSWTVGIEACRSS